MKWGATDAHTVAVTVALRLRRRPTKIKVIVAPTSPSRFHRLRPSLGGGSLVALAVSVCFTARASASPDELSAASAPYVGELSPGHV